MLLLGYHRSERRRCSQCWADMDVRTLEVAGLPVWRTVETRFEPPPDIARFMPVGHVHDAVSSGRRETLAGVVPSILRFVRTYCKMGDWPSEFARTLGADPAFGNFLDSKVERGDVDLATLRRLIAVPSWKSRSIDSGATWDDEVDHAKLMRTGTELYAAYRGVAPDTVDLWNGFGIPQPEPRFLPPKPR